MANMAAEGSPRYGAATSTVLLPVIAGAPVSGRLLGASSKGIYLCLDSSGKPDEIPSVVAILPVSSVRLPLAMVTPELLPAIASAEPIAVGEGVVRIGSRVWHPTRWFDPRPSCPRPAEPTALAEAAEALWNLHDDEIGLSVVHAWRAAAALAAGDGEPCRDLIGAGPGLTPAGDDVVAGALAACALSGGGLRPRELNMLLSHAGMATTALSAALLCCAARGQVVPQTSELLRALSGPSRSRGSTAIAPALAHLRAVGATSGTALAIGLVAALTVTSAGTPAFATERPQSWAVAP
jgi:hypothetical protein